MIEKKERGGRAGKMKVRGRRGMKEEENGEISEVSERKDDLEKHTQKQRKREIALSKRTNQGRTLRGLRM